MFQGKGFGRGYESSDYNVAIGETWCLDVDVTVTEISCAPPDELPESSLSRKRRRKKRAVREVAVDVVVHIGSNLQYFVGSITYQIPQKNTVPVIPLASAFSVLAVIVIALIIGESELFM